MVLQDSESAEIAGGILDDFDRSWGYFFESCFHSLFKGHRFSLWLGYLLLMVLWALTSFICELLFSINSSLPDSWWYWPYYGAVVGCPIWFLNAAKKKLRKSLPAILKTLPTQSAKGKFMKRVHLMGDKRKQAVFSLSFGLICFLVLSFQPIVMFSNTFALLHIAFWTFVAGTITATGLWLAVTSVMLAVWYSGRDDLIVDFVNQAQTKGISALASMMGYYATLFTLQVLVWEIPYLITALKAKSTSIWGINQTTFYISSVIFAVFMGFVLWYFIFPQYKIIRLVNKYKQRILEDIQSRIHEIYDMDDDFPHTAPMLGEYLTLYKEVESQQRALPAQNILGFGASFFVSFILPIGTSLLDLLG